MGETEHPMEYYQKIKRKWILETDNTPDRDHLHTTMFRKVLLEGLPHSVRSRLEDVVGLNYKPEAEFCEHLTHEIERYRRDEKKQKDQEREVLRKVAQLQLSEMTSGLKHKKKVQAPVMEAGSRSPSPPEPQVTQAPILTQAAPPLAQPPAQFQQLPQPVMSTQAQPYAPVPVQMPGPYPPQQPAPIVIYAQPPQGQQQPQQRPGFQTAPRGRGFSNSIRGGRGRGFTPPGNADGCFRCGQKGHMSRECPMNSQGGQWGQRPQWQVTQSVPRGPANHWAGPNAGY